ncbi:hypothetical protein [Nitrospirillum viridazoti]|uniref:hypothetical protein n=1 Tax=Nitrospirillum viridazoti TaxID=3144925 RepID=UPI00110FF77B|nr:hypothetical protein [Nitrospirillum amazonense]
MKSLLGIIFVAMMAIYSGAALASIQFTPWMKLKSIGAGWYSAEFGVTPMDQNVYNPDSCAISDGYVIDPSLGGATVFTSTLTTAYASGHEVRLAIAGCYNDRPSIIGVTVRIPGTT